MSPSRAREDASQPLPPSIAGKSAEQIEDILAMIDSGELTATRQQRAYIAGALYGIKATTGH
ncbi:hypothetical protein GCM10023346_00380 [Arthrobacter gyeryongensis]|uniref:Uncharacterized protein n=1 Tax=Arthrobacter gyeryongensis TaxID=1650592 RepID=A0ABP9RWQ9_9MICC